jgi:hypothetical protein
MEAEEIMIHPDRRPCPATSRRGFFTGTLGLGLGLGTAGPLTVPGRAPADVAPYGPALSEYERILSETSKMDLVGNPRSWMYVSRVLHPFAPERTAILRSGAGSRYGKDVRERIDRRIERENGHMQGFDKRWFPDAKRDSIYWIVDRMAGHYRSPALLEEWVAELAGREILGSTAYTGMGFAHQYQHSHDGRVPLDCPPIDWWLFLYPDGVDWAALDEEPIFAVMAPVAPDRSFVQWQPGTMLRVYCLADSIRRAVSDSEVGWQGVSRMGRIDAARYLNRIATEYLEKQS